jgi:hypothetical protein
MAIYIIIYLIVASAVIVERIRNVQASHKQLVMLLLLVLLTLFRGLRWETGTDWEQFQDLFDTIEFDDIFGRARYLGVSVEPGYAFFNWLFSRLTGSYTCFLIFYNAIILGIFYNCSWRYFPDRPVYPFVILFFFSGIFPLRQAWACAIFLYSFRYILSNNLLKFGICVILATSIHNSAILTFPFYFIFNRKISTVKLVILYFICIFLSLSPVLNQMVEAMLGIAAAIIGVDSSIIMKIYNYAMVYEHDAPGGWKVQLISIIRALLFITLFSLFRSKFQKDKVYNLFYNCFFVSLYVGTLFAHEMQVIGRMVQYFNSATCIMLAFAMSNLSLVKRNLLYGFILLYAAYVFHKNIYGNGWEDLFFPYKTALGGLL